MADDLLAKGLDSDISHVHQRFAVAMEGRLPTMGLETKERYFAVLCALVAKLESADKSLRDILQEMMAETAQYVFQEMGASR